MALNLDNHLVGIRDDLKVVNDVLDNFDKSIKKPDIKLEELTDGLHDIYLKKYSLFKKISLLEKDINAYIYDNCQHIWIKDDYRDEKIYHVCKKCNNFRKCV